MSTATLTAPPHPQLLDEPLESPRVPVVIPTAPPSDVPYEIIDGQIKEKTLGFTESEIATIIAEFLGPFVRTHALGRVVVEGLFRIDADRKLQRRPDVAFISTERRPPNRPIESTAFCDLAPDLAIEVNSPTNTADDLLRKVHEYFKAGVSRVWVVFPSEHEVYAYSSPHQVQIFNLDQSIEDQSLFPGFQLPLKTLFDIQPSTLPLDHGNA